jgi:predicted transcriptional regulator
MTGDHCSTRKAIFILENLVSSVKAAMTDIIGRQPDDSSYDEILRELAFARMVQCGLQDSDAGRTVSDDEMKRKIDSWRK